MIIKKKNFNLTPGYKGKWPFTVPEVAVVLVKIDGAPHCLAVVHNWAAYALSGLLESHGFAKLENSGIWQDEWIMGETLKKSLSPFFEYLEMKVNAEKQNP